MTADHLCSPHVGTGNNQQEKQINMFRMQRLSVVIIIIIIIIIII
jgi:t-SNARE complex subunit (syntaxin)